MHFLERITSILMIAEDFIIDDRKDFEVLEYE